jgi:hypothetical protein
LVQFNKKWKYHQAAAQVVPISLYPRRGRSAAQDQKEMVGNNFQGDMEIDPSTLEAAKTSLGRFFIATNELDPSRLPAAAMLENYKDEVLIPSLRSAGMPAAR